MSGGRYALPLRMAELPCVKPVTQALPPLNKFDEFMPSLRRTLVFEYGRKLDCEFDNLPVSTASTNARRHAEIGALCKLVMRWMVIFELAPANTD